MVMLKRESPYLLETHTEVFTGEISLRLVLKHCSKKKKWVGNRQNKNCKMLIIGESKDGYMGEHYMLF